MLNCQNITVGSVYSAEISLIRNEVENPLVNLIFSK